MSDRPGAVGTWLLNFMTPIGELAPEVVLNADGTGSAVFELGTIEISDAVYDGDSVTFSAKVMMPMGEIDLAFVGAAEGDNLSGALDSPVGPIPVAGTRLS